VTIGGDGNLQSRLPCHCLGIPAFSITPAHF
jgi:hypothetical protein